MNQNDSLPPGVPALTSSSSLANYWFDTEKREQLLVRRFVQPGMTFFDVGAHIGRYTRLFSVAAGPQGRVFAFEPTPTTAARLARAIRAEKMDNVELVQAAVSQKSGTAVLHMFPEEYSTWNGLGTPKMEDPKNHSKFVPIAQEVPVPTLCLDEFCRNRGIDRIDYFKLDVEGMEYQALLGLEDMLRRQAIGALQFEVSKKMLEGLNTTAGKVFRLLESHGYHCHSIGEQGEVGPKLSDSNSFYENYIALPARMAAAAVPAVPAPVAKPAGPKFSFVTIVLNGMPFLEPALQAVYEFAHEIIVVEGAVDNCRFAANADGSSTDGTVECLRRFPDPGKKLRVLQGRWPEKCEMHNAALAQVTGDYVWLMDADEIYRREDLDQVADLVRRDPTITQINFIPDNFWKGFDHLMISPYFFTPEAHYRRVFKFQPGAAFTTHRPPTLVWPGQTRSTEQMNCIPGEITRAMGVIPFHYSYVVAAQVAQKIELYNRYGWGKNWQLDMNQWFRECWQAWTPENRDEIERRWPVWTGGKGSRTVPFHGEHPAVMKSFIATFRQGAATPPPPAPRAEANPMSAIHAIIGSRTYLEKTLAGWQHIQLDAPLQLRVRNIRAALAEGRPFWNNHVAFAFLADRLQPATYLEIGVRVGASMVQVLTHAPVKVAAGIDLWAGEYAGLPNTKEFTAGQLTRHRQATGGEYDVHLLQGDSHKVMKDLIRQGCQFNLINVNGDHSDAGALEDLEDAYQLLTPRGAILFDDIIHPSHRSLLNVVRTFVSRHPELTLVLNTTDDKGVAIVLRGVTLNELLPETSPPAAVVSPVAPPAAKPVVEPPKNLKVAEDYAREKDLTKVDGESEFARAIRKLFQFQQPRRIIETGTYLGTGTTRVIAETLRDLHIPGAIFHSIEINPEHFAKARGNLRAAGLEAFVNLQRGLSVPRSLLPTMAQIEESTVRQPEFGGIFVDHREAQRAKLYFSETNFSGCPDDLLGLLLRAFENRPDFVLLDSGGHMGFVEFQYLISKLAGPCLIALDDIHHIKHHKSLHLMRRDPRFEILVESEEKFGFCIARFSPAVIKPSIPQGDPASGQPGRILWVRTDSIGDAVLAAAMLEPVRKKHPQAQLAVLCQQQVADLYLACPFVDAIICFDAKKMDYPAERAQILAEIAAFQPDLIINSVRSRDQLSHELTLGFQAARHVGIAGDLNNLSEAARQAAEGRYEQIVKTPDRPLPELERHAEFLRGLDIAAGPLQPLVWTAPADEQLADAFFQQQGFDPAKTIALFPGAQHDMRVYHGYGAALQGLTDFRFLIFGDAAQEALASELEQSLAGRTVNLCGRTRLRETAALLRRCRLYVGAESAGAHLACAVGVPNVVVLGGGHFGRFMPYSPLTTAAVLPLNCFGCNWRCVHPRHHCVKDLDPAVLAEAIRLALEKPAAHPRLVFQAAAGAGLPAWANPQTITAGMEAEVVVFAPENSAAARPCEAGGIVGTPAPLWPKISIVIPSFNQGQYIEDTITSILDQGYPEVEIIVCDGGSTDATVEVLKKYDRQLTYWVSEKDRGQTDAINKGLRRATGQILAYLNSDDFLLPHALHYIAQAYQAHPQAGLYSGNGLIVDGHKLNPRQYMRAAGYTYESLLRGSCYLLQPSTFINRKAWEKVGDFDVTLRFAMDLDYWLRVGRDCEVVLLNEPLSAWRMHEDIKTANGGLIRWIELWQVYRKQTKDQITPGLLVELFSVLKQPLISQQLGMDIRGLASQGFNALYAEMQKTLQLQDCVPVGQGTIFKPVAPAGTLPIFRAYPPRPAAITVAETKPAATVQAPSVSTLRASTPSQQRVDIVLQATGNHAWAVGGGWENAARQLGLHHRTFRPRATWNESEPAEDDGLFAYLGNPQADLLLLAGFDWHSQPLHGNARWQDRWAQCRARKILYVQESVRHNEQLAGSKIMEQSFRRAAALVDAIIYTDLADRELMESAGKPALFQPFGVDDQVFAQTIPFNERRARAFFRGKHQPFAGQASAYGDRRALIQHLLDNQALDLVPYQAKPVTPQELAADFNRYQIAVNFPSVFANHPTRIYEAMACGGAVVTNRTGMAEIDRQFESGQHLFYYSDRDELLQAVQQLAAEPALAARMAAQGRQEVLAKHTLSRRLAEAVAWLSTNPVAQAPQSGNRPVGENSGPAEVKIAATGIIAIDGVIFNLQRGQPHGVSRVWHRLLEQLAKTPLANRIVLFDRDGTAPVIPGIRRRTVAPYDYFQRFDADSLWLQRWCDEEKAALLLSTYFTYAETTPTVIMLHDMIPELTGQNLAHCEWRAKTKAINKAFGYLAVSQSTVNDFHRLNPQLADRKIFLTPNAVGDELHPVAPAAVTAFREQHGIRKPYFLLVGHRPQYKNAQLFFRAFAQLPDRSRYEIVCAGGAPKLEEEFLPCVQGVQCHVLRLSDEELSAAYSGALALAYPSRHEGFGLPILEAQKCGCPVITCRNSSLPEVAGDAVIYVGETDEAAMRQALLEVQRPELREALAVSGASNARRFSWETTAGKVAGALETFCHLAASRPPSAADPIDSLWRLIFILDQENPKSEPAREISRLLRIIAWQYEDLECYDHARVDAAEAAVAGWLNALPPAIVQRLAPLTELDRLTALVLGLAAEARQEWTKAWEFYSRALTSTASATLRFRLAVRLSRIAARGGDAAMAESVRQQILPKLRAALPKDLDAAEEEKAVLDWLPVLQPAARITPSLASPARPSSTPAAGPLVTAIVSTYKSERFLRGCLEDLEAQTMADRLEIIVVDSHSPQNERAIVEEFQQRYSNIVYIRTQERETVYGAWNRGARAARGKYLTNANTDDRHRADALEILARTLEENPGVSLAYADCLITPHENETYDTGNPTGAYHWLDFNAQDLWTKGCFAGPQPMWRREVHEEHGYFDAAMISAGDYEFWLRLAQNRTFLHVHQALGLYLKSPTSVEHANRDVGAKEVQTARDRYRDAIMYGKPAFRPRLPEPAVQVEVMTGGNSAPVRDIQSPAAPSSAPKTAPAVARLGQLNEARALLEQKEFAPAWAAALTAIALRPFHPEAFLLLAKIARGAGAGKSARRLAQHARSLAPGWDAAKQFLGKPLKGEAKFVWLETGLLRPSAPPRLSVCLIVKNEEQFLPQCLKSIRELQAQVIVVDTGSTDRTVEIAREFGAEIYAFPWCDDFAAARNAALEHATGDWVLMLDADEELPAAQHARLRADMQDSTVIAFRLPLVNAGQENEGCSYVPRLFRNAPGAFFSGRIHEQVFGSLLENAKSWGLKTALGTAGLLHHGYSKDLVRDRDKIARNLKLLRAALAESPADANLLMNLGLELVRSGDLTGGIAQYRAAFELMSSLPADKLVPELREVLLTQFTSQLYKLQHHEEVVRVLSSPLAQRGGLTASLHFALGLSHYELKQFPEAAAQMRLCLAKRQQPGLTPINTDIHTAVPQHCIALCETKLGHAAEAELAFQAALAETVSPANAAVARLDYAKFLRNENRPVDALHQLHGLVTANPRDLGAWCTGAEIALGHADFMEVALDWTGEALQALPENPMLAVQRAEALMLNSQPAAAAPLWEKIWSSEHDPRILAALILCETALGRPLHAPHDPDQSATSRAFLHWYQKLIAVRAQPLVDTLNGRLEPLSRVLPQAAELLQNALSDVVTPAAVAG